jgi:NADPH:quinone reductase-like Zn-dependent oxidoreductase
VHASAVTTADCMMRKGEPWFGRLILGFPRPKNPIPGAGFSGEVVALGQDVTSFEVGDRVFGETTETFGAHAELLCLSQSGVLLKMPASMSYEEAAPLCDGALTSISFLKDIAHVQPGQRVLINGASGSLGTAAVQLAKLYGAEVTGVCSTSNVELVRSLGADHVVDHTQADFTKLDRTYDVIFDTVGKRTFSECKNALAEHGVYLSPVLARSVLWDMLWTSKIGTKKAKFSATGLRPAPELLPLLREVKARIEDGTLKTVIDRRYPLEQLADAHTYVETGRKRGNVVATLA